jgi:hypothetical protein
MNNELFLEKLDAKRQRNKDTKGQREKRHKGI